MPTQESPKQPFFTGPVLIVCAAILWGLDGVLRRSLQGVTPITIVFLEHAVGFAMPLRFIKTLSLENSQALMSKISKLLSDVESPKCKGSCTKLVKGIQEVQGEIGKITTGTAEVLQKV